MPSPCYRYMYSILTPFVLSRERIYLKERRAKTHERFYMIEVHRHRFARHARKVPFEKCEHWRKVCGRSAKDQILVASILYNKLPGEVTVDPVFDTSKLLLRDPAKEIVIS